jgi:hypothetical protein
MSEPTLSRVRQSLCRNGRPDPQPAGRSLVPSEIDRSLPARVDIKKNSHWAGLNLACRAEEGHFDRLIDRAEGSPVIHRSLPSLFHTFICSQDRETVDQRTNTAECKRSAVQSLNSRLMPPTPNETVSKRRQAKQSEVRQK